MDGKLEIIPSTGRFNNYLKSWGGGALHIPTNITENILTFIAPNFQFCLLIEETTFFFIN